MQIAEPDGLSSQAVRVGVCPKRLMPAACWLAVLTGIAPTPVFAQLGPATDPAGHPVPASIKPGTARRNEPHSNAIEEVVITASKRSERIRKVANSVTAFTGAQLQAIGAQSLEDFIGRTPGVIFDGATPGVSNVVIRGVGTATAFPDQGQSTTGIYLNDIPLTDPGFAVSTPDIDVFDVQRVEVLRGPQGTLFGTATLGGAVNYILNPVSLDRYNGHAEASVYGTAGSSDVGQAVKVAVNLPLIKDVFGVRLTATERTEPGYLDNIGINRPNANSQNVTDFRVNALWKIFDGTTLNFFSFFDRLHNGDNFDAFPALGDLKRSTFVAEYSTFDTQINSLKLQSNLGFANLTVIGSLAQKRQNSEADLSLFFGAPTSGPAFARSNSSNVEVRLASPGGQTFDWLVGFYHGNFHERYPTPSFQNGVDIFDFNVNYKSVETSGFFELTYHYSDQLRATFGGRYFNIGIHTVTGQSAPPAPEEVTAGQETGKGFSPTATLTYEPNSNFLVYGRVSKGFRSGGVNLVSPLAGFATPPGYGPDTLINYEVGVRPSWFDHRLTLDSTLFYIDWKNIQTRLARPDGFAYVANAGVAHNFGFENALTWHPTRSLDLQVNATVIDAELAQSLSLGNGTFLSRGSQLPGSSRYTTSELVTYRFDAPWDPFVRVSHRFVSRGLSSFAQTPPSPPVGNYNIVDLQLGMKPRPDVDLTLFVNNVANERGVAAADVAGDTLQDFYVRPLTGGIRMAVGF